MKKILFVVFYAIGICLLHVENVVFALKGKGNQTDFDSELLRYFFGEEYLDDVNLNDSIFNLIPIFVIFLMLNCVISRLFSADGIYAITRFKSRTSCYYKKMAEVVVCSIGSAIIFTAISMILTTYGQGISQNKIDNFIHIFLLCFLIILQFSILGNVISVFYGKILSSVAVMGIAFVEIYYSFKVIAGELSENVIINLFVPFKLLFEIVCNHNINKNYLIGEFFVVTLLIVISQMIVNRRDIGINTKEI